MKVRKKANRKKGKKYETVERQKICNRRRVWVTNGGEIEENQQKVR